MTSNVTEDLSKFGYRKVEKASKLLNAYIEQGVPKYFYDNKVKVMFNSMSGCVFLSNSEYQTLMLDGDELKMWHFLPYEGEEGFADDLREMYEDDPDYFHREDIEYMKDYEIIN